MKALSLKALSLKATEFCFTKKRCDITTGTELSVYRNKLKMAKSQKNKIFAKK